jgi:hypothetical protein
MFLIGLAGTQQKRDRRTEISQFEPCAPHSEESFRMVESGRIGKIGQPGQRLVAFILHGCGQGGKSTRCGFQLRDAGKPIRLFHGLPVLTGLQKIQHLHKSRVKARGGLWNISNRHQLLLKAIFFCHSEL